MWRTIKIFYKKIKYVYCKLFLHLFRLEATWYNLAESVKRMLNWSTHLLQTCNNVIRPILTTECAILAPFAYQYETFSGSILISISNTNPFV